MIQDPKDYPDRYHEIHKNTKSRFETRTCSYDDWGYDSRYCPHQVVICAAGWPAKLLTWIFRIKPCLFTGTKEQCWPKKELVKYF